jgi:succinyl-diaminopimelate desuccinylase
MKAGPYREVTNVTQARGGLGRNVIPPSLELHVNVRFAPGRTPEDAERELRKRVGDRAQVVVTDRSIAGNVPCTNEVLERFRAVAKPKVAPKQAWTDVARLGARGIDAVNYGPGFTAQAHQKDERASVELMAKAHASFLQLLGGP